MSGSASFSGRHYTFERDNRELQLDDDGVPYDLDYTFERDNRELQRDFTGGVIESDYTFERDNRELQQIPFHQN